MKPRISILMPAYNAGAFIADAIRSVQAQRFTDWELVVVNDGSTDDTADTVLSFRDERIRLINAPHGGISRALNAGLCYTESNLVARFDADDRCKPHRLQVQYDFMLHHPDIVISGGGADYMDAQGRFVFPFTPQAHTPEELRALPIDQCPFIHSTVIFRKDVILQCGGYSERAHTFEDQLLWRAVLQRGKGQNLHEALIDVRLSPQSVTMDERWRPRRFHEIRTRALQTGWISAAESEELLDLIRSSNAERGEGAYHILLGKKFLWDNHQPRLARANLAIALRHRPSDPRTYALWLASFLPGPTVKRIYQLSRKRKGGPS